jgi:hypothetical protein
VRDPHARMQDRVVRQLSLQGQPSGVYPEIKPLERGKESMMKSNANLPLTRETQRERLIVAYAQGLDAVGATIPDLRLAIGRCGEDELYDDPRDPLGRAARLVGTLEEFAAEGLRLAEDDRLDTPADPVLIRDLLESVGRLTRELPELSAILAHHLSIRENRPYR